VGRVGAAFGRSWGRFAHAPWWVHSLATLGALALLGVVGLGGRVRLLPRLRPPARAPRARRPAPVRALADGGARAGAEVRPDHPPPLAGALPPDQHRGVRGTDAAEGRGGPLQQGARRGPVGRRPSERAGRVPPPPRLRVFPRRPRRRAGSPAQLGAPVCRADEPPDANRHQADGLPPTAAAVSAHGPPWRKTATIRSPTPGSGRTRTTSTPAGTASRSSASA
jgi:hypothetical protein